MYQFRKMQAYYTSRDIKRLEFYSYQTLIIEVEYNTYYNVYDIYFNQYHDVSITTMKQVRAFLREFYNLDVSVYVLREIQQGGEPVSVKIDNDMFCLVYREKY